MRVPARTSMRGLIRAPFTLIQTSILRRQLCPEAEQKIYLTDSEQAVTRKNFLVSSLPLVPPPPDTLEYDLKPGEGRSQRHDATQRPARLKPPDRVAEDLYKAGGPWWESAPAMLGAHGTFAV